MERGTLKSSTIFVATGAKTAVYRSVDDVPPDLRKKLAASLNGLNSATVLIADRRGKDEITRLIQALPSGQLSGMGLKQRFAGTLKSGLRCLHVWFSVLLAKVFPNLSRPN